MGGLPSSCSDSFRVVGWKSIGGSILRAFVGRDWWFGATGALFRPNQNGCCHFFGATIVVYRGSEVLGSGI